MLVKLDKNLFNYLITKLNQERENIAGLKYKVDKEENTFTINENISDEIRDWAGEKLQEVGFDKNYNLTDEGKKLERIIDLFYVQ